MEPTFGAILIIGHFVVSVFQFSLGNPVYQFVGYPSMEICQQYAAQLQGQFPINTEYSLVKRTQCMTKEDYDAAIAERDRQLQQQQQNFPMPLQ